MSDEHAAETTDAVVGKDRAALSVDPAVLVTEGTPVVEAGADTEAVVDIESLAYADGVDDGDSDAGNPALSSELEMTPEMLRKLANGPDDDPERLALLDRLLADPALSEAYYDLLVQSLERDPHQTAPLQTGTTEAAVTSEGRGAPAAAAPSTRPEAASRTTTVTPGGTLVVPFASSRLLRWIPVAVLALLAILSVPLLRKRPPAPIDPMSGAGTGPAALITPEPDAKLSPDARFSWHRMPGALSYEVVLFDQKGQVLQRQATSDTLVAASGAPAGTSAWSVTTLMADGTSRASEIRRLGQGR